MKTILSDKNKNEEIKQITKEFFSTFMDEGEEEYLVQNYLLPAKYISLYLADFENVFQENKIKQIKIYLKNIYQNLIEGNGLFLSGPVGVGKSAIATVILKYVIQFFRHKDFRSRYSEETKLKFSVGNLIHFWQSSLIPVLFFSDREYFLYKMKASIIVIDDIAKISSEIYKENLDLILRYRELNSLPTIITSQVPLEKLEEIFGTPIADLIKGNTKEIAIVGDSLRNAKRGGK